MTETTPAVQIPEQPAKSPMPAPLNRDEAISRIIAGTARFEKLHGAIQQTRAAAVQQCELFQNEMNQIVGRNETLLEAFNITAADVQKVIEARKSTSPTAGE